MEPTLEEIIKNTINLKPKYKIGDIVTFRDYSGEEGEGTIVVRQAIVNKAYCRAYTDKFTNDSTPDWLYTLQLQAENLDDDSLCNDDFFEEKDILYKLN